MCAVPAAFPLASARAGARKDAPVRLRAVVYPGPIVADEWVAPDAVRLDVRAKCQAEDRDFLLALDRDFQKAVAARLAVAPYWGALAHRDVQEQFPARQPLAALQKVVCSRGPQPPVEPVRLRAVTREL